MAFTEIVVITLSGLIAVTGAMFSRPPKKHECIKAYGTCIERRNTDETCNKILTICDMEKELEKLRANESLKDTSMVEVEPPEED